MLRIRRIFPPRRFAREFSFTEDRVPSQIGGPYHPMESFSQIGRHWMPLMQLFFGHNKFAVGIKYNEIRVVACGNATLARAATCQASRAPRHPAR